MNFRFILAHAAFVLGLSLSNSLAQVPYGTQLGDDKYKPTIGQDGKDVIWVPTNDAMADSMLKMANVGPDDLVYDLGAGDGKIAIAAAKTYGARSVGIEYNKDMADLAARNAQRAGVDDKVKIIHGDIFVEDFSKATVLTLYLLPDLNLKLRPTILKMTPGTRVVTNSFHMGDWEPDQVIGSGYPQGYFWVVPADVAGKWTIRGINGGKDDTLDLVQRYQKVGGTLTVGGKPQAILGATLRGKQLKFSFIDQSGATRAMDLTVNRNSLTGNVSENMPIYDVFGIRR